MAEQNVTIHICNEQVIDGKPETVDMTVLGTALQNGNRLELHYSEYDEDMRETKTIVTAEGNQFVSVTRSGAYESQMLFELHKRNTTVYKTPYGDILMGMYTKSIENAVTLDAVPEGKLTFCYTTDFSGQGGIENQMTLHIAKRI